MSKSPWIVCKFGGTSVKSVEKWHNIKEICQNHLKQGLKPLVVCSAISQMSNQLEALLTDAKQGHFQERLQHIQEVYATLAADLDVDFHLIESDFKTLENLCNGIALLNEVSDRTHARILAMGEIMLTRLGCQFLQSHGINTHLFYAHKTLKAKKRGFHKNYLHATCETAPDPDLEATLSNLNADVFITQGFMAGNEKFETVLLGRGGSDTSAAYFSAKLQAQACEIWTDVPGVYTANPKMIPEARLLTHLDYDEVQEIASVGGKILHPNCIEPLKAYDIPLWVKFTEKPQNHGTKISYADKQNYLPIKSILTQYGIILINIESIRMWQHAGFLADIFNCFKHFDVSVDLISTSESSVSVSLDPYFPEDHEKIEALIEKLSEYGQVKKIGPCASISLVGRHIRAILPKISEIFSVFESQQVHLLSQAANDLNLTFVVDEDQAERLAKKLHHLLIDENPKSHLLSKSWLEEFGDVPTATTPWWETEKTKLLNLAGQTPAYVYHEQTLIDNAKALQSCKNVDAIFFAIKANPNDDILKIFKHLGLGFECVSMEEVEHVLTLFPDLPKDKILFTPNFAPKAEYLQALALGIHLTIDSTYPLQHWPEIFKDQSLMLRVDPGYGDGHHKYVCTGGTESKFGIPLADLAAVAEIAQKNAINIVGLHTHSGSGILQSDAWYQTALQLTRLIELFPKVTHIDIGGGLGIVEKPGQKSLDLQIFDASLNSIKISFPNLKIWMEPGRYLVANAGVLLAKVTQVKQKGEMTFVGLETGMNSLIRPALYGSYHHIDNLSKLCEPKTMVANIVGPICESGDTLGYSRLLPETVEDDVLIIDTAGAYGYCMSSHYNKRKPAQEMLLRAKND